MGRQTYRVKITNEEIIASINKDNQKLMSLFLKEKERKCSP